MAGTSIQMIAEKKISLQEINRKIRNISGAEQVSNFTQRINDVEILTLVFEKYYLRTGSFTSVTIVLTEYGEEQTACVVSSGGGEGLVNFSMGANRNFAKACVQELEACGFVAMNSELNSRGKGIVERFLE